MAESAPDDVTALVLTAIVRDYSAVAAGAADEPSYRTVRFALTAEQSAKLATRNGYEAIARVIVERAE